MVNYQIKMKAGGQLPNKIKMKASGQLPNKNEGQWSITK